MPGGKGTDERGVLQTGEYGKINEKDRIGLIIQTICSTGIRISELIYITVASVHTGVAFATCKGKSRQIFLPHKLRMLLMKYIRQNQIRQGPVFLTREGKPVNRSNVWKEMKALCASARVLAVKVFPHNLRHLLPEPITEWRKIFRNWRIFWATAASIQPGYTL